MTACRKVLVLLSGGIDSMCCTAWYSERSFSVSALFINYGQVSASKETSAVKALARELRVPLAEVSTTGLSIPQGEIPGRNALLLATALMAFPVECGLISIGIHSGTSYRDCGPTFIRSMQRVFDSYVDGRIRIDAPFMKWPKTRIIEYAKSKTLPVHLTYSCELGLEQPCGRCISCGDIEALHAS